MLSTSVLNNIVKNMLQLSNANLRSIAIMPDDYPDRYIKNQIVTKCHVTDTGHFL